MMLFWLSEVNFPWTGWGVPSMWHPWAERVKIYAVWHFVTIIINTVPPVVLLSHLMIM